MQYDITDTQWDFIQTYTVYAVVQQRNKCGYCLQASTSLSVYINMMPIPHNGHVLLPVGNFHKTILLPPKLGIQSWYI